MSLKIAGEDVYTDSLPTYPDNRYPGMDFSGQSHRGKGWYKPARATAIVIKAMHKGYIGHEAGKGSYLLGSRQP